MARLHDPVVDTDDELPELSQILRLLRTSSLPNAQRPIEQPVPAKGEIVDETSGEAESGPDAPLDIINLSYTGREPKNQGSLSPLKPTNVHSLPHPRTQNTVNYDYPKISPAKENTVRSSPRRKVKASIDYSKFVPRLSRASSSFSGEDDSFTDLSGFIVPDSASDEDVRPSYLPEKKPKQKISKKDVDGRSHNKTPRPSSSDLESAGPIDLNSPKKKNESVRVASVVCPESPPTLKLLPKEVDVGPEVCDLDDPFFTLTLYVNRKTQKSESASADPFQLIS